MDKQKFINDLSRQIGVIRDMHEGIKDINEALRDLQPIAVVDDNILYIFDVDLADNAYAFIAEHPSTWQLPQSVASALMLNCFGYCKDDIAAVIGVEYLQHPDNYAIVFHEFVHCYVWKNYEIDIRKDLQIEKYQMGAGNISWEIDYPFPYEDAVFFGLTQKLLSAEGSCDREDYIQYHKEMKAYLPVMDYEYMVWQEWKEGFARYVETQVRIKQGVSINSEGLLPPFDRHTFYEMGSRYIARLIENERGLASNLTALFHRMMA